MPILKVLRDKAWEVHAYRKARKFKLFDPDYYAKQVAPANFETKSGWLLWKHYSTEGAFTGLNPSEWFDSSWYLHTYSDVRQAEINPLAHFVCYGAAEGRLPQHGARWQHFSRPPHRGDITQAAQLLWSGYEHLALPKLGTLEKHSWKAAFELAAWDYFQGDNPSATRRLLAIVDKKPPHSKALALGLAKCAAVMGGKSDVVSGRSWGQTFSSLDSLARQFVEANFAADDDERLACVNKILQKADLARLTVTAKKDPLSLEVLGGLQVPRCQRQEALVSIVVPAFNAEATLAWSVRSLLSQSWSRLEVIIVDDASSDGTSTVAQALCDEDSRVRYIRNSQNRGAYATRNVGMLAGTGDFVTVQDSDDWSHPQKIERQIRPMLSDRSIMATGSNWVRTTEELRFVGSWILGESFLEKNHSAWLFRRSVLEQVGLWDEVKVAADTEFLWRVEHHFGFASMPIVDEHVPLSFSLAGESSLTRTKATHVKTVFFGLRRLYREASSWWHRACYLKPILQTERPFPVPLGILQAPCRNYDAVVAANFSLTGKPLVELLEGLDALVEADMKLCLLHWPDRRCWQGNPISDPVFDWAQRNCVNFAHVGFEISAKRVILADPTLWEVPTTESVKVQGAEAVVSMSGELCPDQRALLSYFSRGGLL